MTISWNSFLSDMGHELVSARCMHDPMPTAHHAYSVILEELEEFWEEVRKKEPSRDAMRNELIQVATMAWRAAEDLELG